MKKEKIKKKRRVSERGREELYNEYEYDNDQDFSPGTPNLIRQMTNDMCRKVFFFFFFNNIFLKHKILIL